MNNKQSRPFRRSPRMKTHDYTESYYYSLTVCTHGRKRLFTSSHVNQILIDTLRNYADRYSITLYAYCLLPDHLHILACPEGTESVPKFINMFKGRITFLLRKRGIKGRIWQRGFYDHIIRHSESLETVTKYILENPVRKGIIDRFENYQWSSDSFGIKANAIESHGWD